MEVSIFISLAILCLIVIEILLVENAVCGESGKNFKNIHCLKAHKCNARGDKSVRSPFSSLLTTDLSKHSRENVHYGEKPQRC